MSRPIIFTEQYLQLLPVSWSAPKIFQKKWFFALFIALLVILIVETSMIIFFLVASSLGRQAFPSFDLSTHLKLGCETLVPTVVATTMNNRTVQYSCPGQGALYMPMSCPFYGCGPADCCGANPVFVKPEFLLPPGYLRLSLVNVDQGNCTSPYAMLLLNDQNLTLGGQIFSGGNQLSYNYCAVVTGQSGPIQGFSIRWSEVPLFGICCTITASPSQLTIPETANASSTSIITITALGKYFGNVSINGGGEGPGYTGTGPPVNTGWTWRFNPSFVILKPGGSNSTTVTIILVNNPAPQTFLLVVSTYPDRYYTGVTGTITVKVP